MAGTAYSYGHLDEVSQQIRLLTILPQGHTKVVKLKLDTVRLVDVEGDYDAISYTWGPETPQRHVIVNGRSLLLRKNIWRFLKHCRKTQLTTRRLWIDSICINQKDDQEKSGQVARMGDIFRMANRVLIWLEGVSETIMTSTPEDVGGWADSYRGTDKVSQDLTRMAVTVVYNSYWTRAWIVQEVSLARDAYLIIGTSLLDRHVLLNMQMLIRARMKKDMLKHVTRPYREVVMYFEIYQSNFHPISGIAQSNLYSRQREPLFTEAIQQFHTFKCANNRDRVYSLLTMVNTTQKPLVDYTMNKEETFTQSLSCMAYEARTSSLGKLKALDPTYVLALIRALEVTQENRTIVSSDLHRQAGREHIGLRFNIMITVLIVKTSWSLELGHTGKKPQYTAGPADILNGTYHVMNEHCWELKTPDVTLQYLVQPQMLGYKTNPMVSLLEDAPIDHLRKHYQMDYFPTLIAVQKPAQAPTVESIAWWNDKTSGIKPKVHKRAMIDSVLCKSLEDNLRTIMPDWSAIENDFALNMPFLLSVNDIISLFELADPLHTQNEELGVEMVNQRFKWNSRS